MIPDTFTALVVEQTDPGTFKRSIQERSMDSLPDHEVLIRVHYSSLNYKDALSATGNKGVTQHFPHTPGVDAAGTVVQSEDPRFSEGDAVIVTSYDLGQNTSGGFGQYIRVPGDWIVPLPKGLTLKESMILGTAGFTAAYGVLKLQQTGIEPGDSHILVTGATGGVGSLAVTLLAHLGYTVTAATGKMEQTNFLEKLGAQSVIHRDTVSDVAGRPLLSSKWTGAIDTVGGSMLDAVLRQLKHNGVAACCGNVLGPTLETSIYPFILRGISLMGIDSGICLMPTRKKIWELLAGKWKPKVLPMLYRQCTLEGLDKEINKILKGGQVGTILLKLPE